MKKTVENQNVNMQRFRCNADVRRVQLH